MKLIKVELPTFQEMETKAREEEEEWRELGILKEEPPADKDNEPLVDDVGRNNSG